MTCLSPCSPQGSDSARTRALSGLVWYMSICLIWSVHLSGLSGLIRVLTATDFQSHPQLQVAFKRAQTLQRANRRRWCFVAFLFFGKDFYKDVLNEPTSRSSVLFFCKGVSPSQAGCVMHLLSPLVPWRIRVGGCEQNDACSLAAMSSSWTVRHYEAVRMTSEPYADSVPQSFVPLYYGLAPFVFRHPFPSSFSFFCLML